MAWREWDVEGGWTVRVGGMSVWAGSMLEWGVHTMGEEARNLLVVLEWPEGTGIGQVATWAGGGTESAKGAVWRVATCDRQVGRGDGHGIMDEQALADAG